MIRRATATIGLFICFSVLMFGALPGLACAQSTSTSAPSNDLGKESLKEQSFPWYDAEKDAEKPVHIVADPDETGQRDSNWLGSGDWQTGKTTTTFRPKMSGLSTFFQVLFWIIVAALLLGLSYVVIVAFMKMDAKQIRGGGEEEVEEEEVDRTRIENLPFQVKRPNADLLAEARACYERGEYNDAIIYLYSHQLIELDRRQAIHLTKGKTNRQYLRELRERPNLSSLLENSILLFEEAFFGRHMITRTQMDRCWSKLPDFQRELERVAA